MEDDFGHWLAGWIDGEGCFLINRMQTAYQPRMRLHVRDDDAEILDEIVKRTGIGYVARQPARPSHGRRNNPQAEWRVMSKADCVALVELLDRYPLRAKKARDYAIWREAVLYWAGLEVKLRHGPNGETAGRMPHDWGPMERLRKQLVAGRQYEPRAGSPS